MTDQYDYGIDVEPERPAVVLFGGMWLVTIGPTLIIAAILRWAYIEAPLGLILAGVIAAQTALCLAIVARHVRRRNGNGVPS